jgi:hypothetical protein
VRDGLPVAAVDLGDWPWERVTAAAGVASTGTRLATVDESRMRLARAARGDDGFYSTFVLRRASRPVTALAVRLGVSPNTVTLVVHGGRPARRGQLRRGEPRMAPPRRRPAPGLAGARLRRR